ncbi:MAG: ABC transporter transmembrane domain-containing protein, partial [Hungatella sp.]
MKSLGKYMKRYWYLYVIAILAMIFSVLLDAASPQITKRIIDDVIVGGQIKILMNLLLGLLGIGLGRGIFQYVKEFIFDYSASGIGSQLRKDLFSH